MGVQRRIAQAIESAMRVGTDAWKMQQQMKMDKLEEERLRAIMGGWQSLGDIVRNRLPGDASSPTGVPSRRGQVSTPPTAPDSPPPSASRLFADQSRLFPGRPDAVQQGNQAPADYRSRVYQDAAPDTELSGVGVNQDLRNALGLASIGTMGEFNAPAWLNAVIGPHTPAAHDRRILQGEGLTGDLYRSILTSGIREEKRIDQNTGLPITVTGPEYTFNPNISQGLAEEAFARTGSPIYRSGGTAPSTNQGDLLRGVPSVAPPTTGGVPSGAPPMTGIPVDRSGGAAPFTDQSRLFTGRQGASSAPTAQPSDETPKPDPSTFGVEAYSVTLNVSGDPIEQIEPPQSDAQWMMTTTQKIANAQREMVQTGGMLGSRVNERGQTIARSPLSPERQREIETLSSIAGSLREAGRLGLKLNDHQGTAAILQGLWQKGQKYTGANQDAIKLDQLRNVLAATMARLVGETGRFTEGDVSRGKALIPDLMMSRENTIWLINYASSLLNEKLVGFSRPIDPSILSGEGLPFIHGGTGFSQFNPAPTVTPNNGTQNRSRQINVPNR